jgi:hypothetical protein
MSASSSQIRAISKKISRSLSDLAVFAQSKHSSAYSVANMAPLAIADAPKMVRVREPLPYGGSMIEVDEPGRGSARILSLSGEWIECTVKAWAKWLVVDQEELFAGGMSGSPILSLDGRAIGLVSTGGQNPILRQNLPAWFFRRRHG